MQAKTRIYGKYYFYTLIDRLNGAQSGKNMTYRNRTESDKGIKLSNESCIICGWNEKDAKGNTLVEGAHIRQFNNTADYDKADNIVAMCPNHHIEFDVGNLMIDCAKRSYIRRNSDGTYAQNQLFGKVDHIQPGYFDYHKINVFERHNSRLM